MNILISAGPSGNLKYLNSESKYKNYSFFLCASRDALKNSDQDSLALLRQLVSNFKLSCPNIPDGSLDGKIVVMLEGLADMPVSQSTANLCRSFAPFVNVRLQQVVASMANA